MLTDEVWIASVDCWRPVVGFEGYYEVSGHGQVRSLPRMSRCGGLDGYLRAVKGGLLDPQAQALNGRRACVLGVDGKRTTRKVYRMVLESFIGPCPVGSEACHRNDDPADDRLENLYWGTRSQNLFDMVRNDKHHNAVKTHCKKGHEFSPENTQIRKRGKGTARDCIACMQVYNETRAVRRNGETL